MMLIAAAATPHPATTRLRSVPQPLDAQLDDVARLQPRISIDAVHQGQLEDATGSARARTDHVSGLDARAARRVRDHLAEAPEDIRK